MRPAICALALSACSFTPGALGGSGSDAPGGDDGPTIDVPCTSWSAHHFDACAIPSSSDDVHLVAGGSPYTFDTTTDGGELRDAASALVTITSIDITQSSGVHAALWVGNNVTIDSGVQLNVIGTKPLIVAAWGAIDVAGTIDAGSHAGGQTGAGANPASCAAHAAGLGGDGTSGNGGGGGGGYQGKGGVGGKGDANCTPNPPACIVAGGTLGGAVPAPTTVEGGCNGADSGSASGTRATGGKGGGAILLAARGAITLTGSLLAGGAGGGGDTSATVSTGGGGGGAGGFIGLEGTSITSTGATIAANGGGGGGAGDIAQLGMPGTDGGPTTSAAPGGPGGGAATNGGAGSSLSVLDGQETTESTMNGGGGGGGGGAGFILYWTPAASGTATVSPPALTGP